MTQTVKNLPAVWETCVGSLDWEDPLEKRMATHSRILAREILWTEEPGRLQSMGAQGHNWISHTHTHTKVNQNSFKRNVKYWYNYFTSSVLAKAFAPETGLPLERKLHYFFRPFSILLLLVLFPSEISFQITSGYLSPTFPLKYYTILGWMGRHEQLQLNKWKYFEMKK